MRAWILVGVFILLYQSAVGKPLNRKAKTKTTELIREKRGDLDEDERSSEMQKFMLDLSSKEDMSRLKERFRSEPSQDIENDKEYRRLKRFSIHDNDDDLEGTRVTSGKETMNMRSSRRSLEDGSEDDTKTYDYKSKETKEKGSLKNEHSIDTFNDEKPRDVHQENTERETGGSSLNSHHVIGGSWELIHHYPSESLSTFATVNTALSKNTTMHSEYLKDDGERQYNSDDITQHERAGKSRRKPRVSRERLIRSFDAQYEAREISEIDDQTPESPRGDHEQVTIMDTRAIKRDGYIGCFIDQHPNRDLKKFFTVNNLTPDSCQSVCREKGHLYAGVQYGYLCHCGDEYGKYGEAGEHECDSACRGDEGKKCGGFWRNSVYASDMSSDDQSLDHEDDSVSERETRSQIDRVIPLPQSKQEEKPIRQEITVYLRSEVPKKHARPVIPKHIPSKEVKKKEKTKALTTNSKRMEIIPASENHVKQPGKVPDNPSNVMVAEKQTNVNNNAYLHPQISQKEFIPSNVVLKTLTASAEKRKYTGFLKLKQNWDDSLLNKRSPKTLILAGNIESAFAEMFADDPHFEKAEVLSLREAEIRDNPDTVHKVLAEFAVVFKKGARGKDKKLRHIVETNNRLGEMPVFANSLDIKEYSDEEDDDSEEATPKEKRQGGVDAFLEKVFKQI